jgi:hypothetical protein
MNWKKHFRDWKLAAALALIFALCGHATPHVETALPDYGPTTVFALQASGANTPNVSVGMYSWSSRDLYR